MRFRSKLLLLMLIIGIVPPLVMRLLGVRAVHRLGNELVVRHSAARLSQTHDELRLLVASYAEVLQSGQRQVEMALRYQAQAVQQALESSSESPPHVGRAHSGMGLTNAGHLANREVSKWHRRIGGESLPVSFTAQAFRLTAGRGTQDAAHDMRRLAHVTPVYRALYQQLAGIVLWQSTCLASGVEGIYPGYSESVASAATACLQEVGWPEGAEELAWIDPFPDPLTGQSVLAAAIRLRGQDGKLLGVTRMVVPIARLIDRSLLAASVPLQARILVCHPRSDPASGQPAARILAAAVHGNPSSAAPSADSGGTNLALAPASHDKWLQSDQPEELARLLQDVHAGIGGARRLPFQGQDCQWVYGAAQSGVFLLVIVPQEQIMAPVREAEAIVFGLVDRLIGYTTLVLGGLLVGIVLLALRFSRTVTRPVQALVKGVQRLAAGDFDAQVRIASRDEFGDMGKVFNRVGPRLREHTRLRAALEVAREVQQNLIPHEPPHIAGLQIAARIEYCDETGGDYYDVVGPDPQGRVVLVVGDVSEHGVSAALLMATTRALLRQRIANGGDLAAMVTDVNRQVAADVGESGRFVTLFVALLDPRRGTLHWVRAGHEPALIFAAAHQRWEGLQAGGLPLGVSSAAQFTQAMRRFDPGDILVMATDGLWETRNRNGAMLGRPALERIVQRHRDRDCATMLAMVWDKLQRFRDGLPVEDDITLMIVRLEGSCRAPLAAAAPPPS